jgi:hypothetical protein
MKTYKINFTATGSFITTAKNPDEAGVKAYKELDDLGISTTAEASNVIDSVEITDTVRVCGMCYEPEDDDGNCTCTNHNQK